eukprot:scaffold21838_cov16-Tisochrysis_lutea.AAC.6
MASSMRSAILSGSVPCSTPARGGEEVETSMSGCLGRISTGKMRLRMSARQVAPGAHPSISQPAIP